MTEFENDIGYEIIRSKRKTAAIQITADLRILIRVPYDMRQGDIERFICEKKPWIEKHMELMEKRLSESEARLEETPKFTPQEIKKLAEEAKTVIPEKARLYAEKIGVSYDRITIRNQVSRWGSCSSKKNLNFNCLLMLAPPDVLDYVVVHELCHLKQLNHSPEFWEEVGKVIPNYNEKRQWLKTEGIKLIERL